MFALFLRCLPPAAGAVCLLISLAAYPADDPQAARRLAVNHCSQCHTFDQGEPHGQGPNLFGLIGREAAVISGFRFSKGYQQAMAGKVWDAALLERWLADTLAVAPGTTMVYWQDDPAVRKILVEFFQSQQ